MFGAKPSHSADTALAKRTFNSAKDKRLQESIKQLEKSGKELAHLDKAVRKNLHLPSDRTRGFIARTLHYVIPQRFYPSLPNAIVKLVAEEYDVLELIEGLMKGNIDSVQNALRNLAYTAREKREKLLELAGDIEKARTENWSAQKLQEYIAERSGIQIYEEISALLDQEFNILPEKEREQRKNELLAQLESNLALGDVLMETMGKVCGAGLQIFHRGVGQYFDYIQIYRPMTVIRDSAKTMTDMNKSMYAAKDAVVVTFQTSIDAIKTSVDLITQTERYSIASADMKSILEKGQKDLDAGLKALQASNGRLALNPQSALDETHCHASGATSN